MKVSDTSHEGILSHLEWLRDNKPSTLHIHSEALTEYLQARKADRRKRHLGAHDHAFNFFLELGLHNICKRPNEQERRNKFPHYEGVSGGVEVAPRSFHAKNVSVPACLWTSNPKLLRVYLGSLALSGFTPNIPKGHPVS